MERDKVLSMIGLAKRSGNVASGEFMTEKMIKTGKAYLVIVAEDASKNTKEMFENKCHFYHVPICCYGNKESLGHAIGNEFRASLAVLDKGLAQSIQDRIKENGKK